MQYAKYFINQIDPLVVKKYGSKFEPIIEAKVVETFGTNLNKYKEYTCEQNSKNLDELYAKFERDAKKGSRWMRLY